MKILQILVLMFGFVIFVNAQRAILSGTVYDGSGAVIPEVKITATNQKGEKFECLTNEEGFYELDLSYSKENESLYNPQTNKYEIIFDRTNWGFKKLAIKNYFFVGRMRLDVALDADNPEPCGYSGADCPQTEPVNTKTKETSNKILQKPLEKLPKKQNKLIRKKKNNK